jgi:hypothetical protein
MQDAGYATQHAGTKDSLALLGILLRLRVPSLRVKAKESGEHVKLTGDKQQLAGSFHKQTERQKGFRCYIGPPCVVQKVKDACD